MQHRIELEGTIDHAATSPGSEDDDFVIPRMTRPNAVMRISKLEVSIYGVYYGKEDLEMQE